MKKIHFLSTRKAIAFLAMIALFFACDPIDGPDKPDPDDPTPDQLLAPRVSLMAAENVTKNTATLVGFVTGNEKGTTAYFSYKTAADANWAKKPIGATFDTTDSVKVTFDLSMLQPETEYSFKLTAENKAGKVESVIRTFMTASNVTAVDFNGNQYKVVKIGNQYWLQENFKGTHFADGTPIENKSDYYEWRDAESPAMCWRNNDPNNKDIFGGLYNAYVYDNSKELITGWHVPTYSEIEQMINHLGGMEAAYEKLLDTSGFWDDMEDMYQIKVNNSSGFTAITSGRRTENGDFVNGLFYLASKSIYASNDGKYYSRIQISEKIYHQGSHPKSGLSIRLIKD